MLLAAGSKLGPYEILAPLGIGGMGEVYRAMDPRLGREIAIKVLPAETSADAEHLARLEREARTVAGLNHPGIVTLFSVEDVGGLRFLTMELVEGRSLDRTVAPGGLPAHRVVEIGIALADALAAAHARGVVHRDLKPANVMITREGRVKVLDFGIAKSPSSDSVTAQTQATTIASPFTGAGLFVGTLPYAAPEQVRGESVGPRTDLFALGVLLYELSTGTLPFAGSSAAELASSILRDDPLPPCERNPDVPADLERVIVGCLLKDPSKRPSAAAEVLEALQGVRRRIERGESAPEAPSIGVPPARPSVAVLPFRDLNARPENADLGLGLADATITELALMQSLIVRPTSTILRYQEARVDPREAATELAVDAVVDGSFQRAGGRLRVTVQLIERSDGRPLWATKIDTSLEDIFRMQDEVSRQIASALHVRLSPTDDRRLSDAARPAPAGDALTSYMGGKRHLFRGTLADVNAAIEHFERACEQDSDYALAWAGLGDAYMRMAFEHAPEGEWQTRAQQMCERALAIDRDLPEARYLQGRLHWNPVAGFDHARALREASAALAARPSLVEAHYLVGLVLFHVGMLDASLEEFRHCLTVDPRDLYAHIHVGTVRLHQGRFDEALEIAEAGVRTVYAPWSLSLLAHTQIRSSRTQDAMRTLERLGRESPDYSEVNALRGLIAALGGDARRARLGIDQTAQNRRAFGHYHHAQYDVACIYAALGDADSAVKWLSDAVHNGYPCRPFFLIDPLLDSLRGHLGFTHLMKELAVECASYRNLYTELRAVRG